MTPLPSPIVPPHYGRHISADDVVERRSFDLWAGVPIEKVRHIVATDVREARALINTSPET